jgi:tRNA(Ile)-lysidine synthase
MPKQSTVVRFSHPRPTTNWSADHHQLHRLLRRHPTLLPAEQGLLLAVSGGQDSMALVALLQALQPQHRWRLTLWHGDHRWRPGSSRQAAELADWARGQGLALVQDSRPSDTDQRASEAAAREWRYGCLVERAQELGCRRVVTGHTASDRAETLLLNLARGSHRRGLAALPRQRNLAPGVELVRPLLAFTRADTARICQEQQRPVWLDPSNADRAFSRNRLRLEVMPVLQALYPGAERRLARLAAQLEEAERASQELLALALDQLETSAPPGSPGAGLPYRRLCALDRANQEQLLQAWLERHTGRRWPSHTVETLLDQLPHSAGRGQWALADGWRLLWQGPTLWLSHEPDSRAR